MTATEEDSDRGSKKRRGYGYEFVCGCQHHASSPGCGKIKHGVVLLRFVLDVLVVVYVVSRCWSLRGNMLGDRPLGTTCLANAGA